MNDLLTPTLLPIQRSHEVEWLTPSHTDAYTKEPRGQMTYSLPTAAYIRAKRVNELFTSTLLLVKKNQEQGCLELNSYSLDSKSDLIQTKI